MISWIQNQLIRRGRWIFLILLAIIITTFVLTIGNTPGCTTDQSGYTQQMFYGYDLNSQYAMKDLAEKVRLSKSLDTGRQFQNNQQFQSALLSRIVLLHLADQTEIPAPSESALARYIQSREAFRGPDGEFSRDAYTRFVDNIESNPSIRQYLIITVLEEDYRIEQAQKILSGPGYYLPSEALAQIQRTETQLKLSTAEINYSEFNPVITPEESDLIAFYENNPERYKIPERIRANYVKFPVDRFAEQVDSPSEERLREHFTANRARFTAAYEAEQEIENDTAEPEETPTPVSFEQVRDKVVSDFIDKAAKRLANQAAQDFALRLYYNKVENDSPEFQKLIDESDLTLAEIPPYTAKETNRRPLPSKMLESAFALNHLRYYSDAYEIDDGFAVLILAEKIPPETPEYETVASAVQADYIAEEKRKRFNEEGERLETKLRKLLEAGNSFAEAAKELDLQVTENESFKVGKAPRTVNRSALQFAQNMQEKELSPMITAGGTGIFVYLEEKEVPEISPENQQLAQTSSWLERYASFLRSSTLLNELIVKGLDKEE